MKNYIAIPLMVIYLLTIIFIYAVTDAVSIADLLIGIAGGFGLGAIFGWVMTSLKNESEAK